uniref:HalD/BesD family halogenase n=1 Tax=Yersinia frederiksenii TaxID=29484 RepID=UPI001F4C3987|nr:hypothetical protein [Yersinia frederiksenii]ULG19785.1 hypothetical protein 49p1_00067 [Yersinia frederiksenii]
MISEFSKCFDLAAHFSTIEEEIGSWNTQFQHLGFVRMDNFIPEQLRYLLELEVSKCLREVATRRDIKVSSTDNSPRKYMSCSRDDIFSLSRIMPAFYDDPALYQVLERITHDKVIKVPFEPEEIVINSMQLPEDEHGWHWDDYRYSLLFIVRAPREGNGGLIEFVPNTEWDKNNPNIKGYLDKGPIYREYVPQGSFYFINGAANLHHVSPLKEADLRIITCFSYAGADEIDRIVSHESMEEIYSL